MDLRQLAYFEAVADHGTYTAAADHLHVAQPALWKLVHELERELGIALFERIGRRVRITPDGAALLERIRPVLAGADRVSRPRKRSARRADRAHPHRVLRAPHRCISCAGDGDVPRRNPDVAVELRDYASTTTPASAASNPLVESLRAGEVDVILSAPFDDEACTGFPVYEVRVMIASPRGIHSADGVESTSKPYVKSPSSRARPATSRGPNSRPPAGAPASSPTSKRRARARPRCSASRITGSVSRCSQATRYQRVGRRRRSPSIVRRCAIPCGSITGARV